ncbi:PD40 domain-containing protein [Shewanella sp. KX20019]|uniref:DPP IV N-terminal domain-containing protein n=1 Tax=Shewanella sp. KX20019 TaxID=2803864 RepID=UPI001928E104|nr:DPP IV N-terminal domain-containing protein [Shewanella sp. KX20019]QQX80048.1 PD40 domain-containing protein [Shewanella sp. KX20019]
MISLPHQKYQIGQCIVNCHDMTISKGERIVTLPAKVFEFLKLLILHAEETVTKEVAIEQVWLGNIEVGKRGTGNAIWQLRKTISELDEEPEFYFKTITKIGYQLLFTPVVLDEKTNQAIVLKPHVIPQHSSSLLKPIVALFSVALLSLLGFLLHSLYAPITVEEPLAVKRITNFEGVEEQAAISPDGRFMAFQWRREQKKAQIYIKDLSDAKAPLRQVSMSEDKETSPTWSPDGQALAYLRFSANGRCELHVRELITNQDRLIDTGCTSRGYLHSLDWSPDGELLAYAKSIDDSVAVFTYHFASSDISQFSYPASGEEDLLMSWSANSEELALVRSAAMDAKIIILSQLNDDVVSIIEGESMVIALEWEQASNMLYFNALRDGAFVIERYSFATQSITDFHQDNTISSIAINEKSNSLYYSRHLSQEHITVRSLTDGQIKRQLASSSRDMFGQFVASSQEVLFLSNRSGAWELWVNQDTGSKQLTHSQGIVGVPAASPVDKHYVLPMKPKGAKNYDLYLGLVGSEAPSKINGIKGDVRNPSFSNDGRKIYYSSNVDGHWSLYVYHLDSQQSEFVVAHAAKYGVEDNAGGVYYSRDNQAGIFYHPNDGGEEQLITAELSTGDWGSFFYQNEALYFLKRSDISDQIIEMTADNQQQLLFTLPAVSIRGQRALAKADDDTIVVSMLGINDADIYSVSLAARP